MSKNNERAPASESLAWQAEVPAWIGAVAAASAEVASQQGAQQPEGAQS